MYTRQQAVSQSAACQEVGGACYVRHMMDKKSDVKKEVLRKTFRGSEQSVPVNLASEADWPSL